MPMNQVVISLGSNIDPQENIQKALQALRQQFPIIRESRFVTTQPIGITDQPEFINGAVLLETPLSRNELKRTLQAIETKLGRKRNGPKFGPRIIDLDIVVWNKGIVDSDVYKRQFLRNAALEVLPELKFSNKPTK